MITITNEDNMFLMAKYPDNYFDLAIVDPPYFEDYGKKNYTGNNISKSGVKRQTKKITNWEIPDENYFNELFRVSKNQIIWGCNYYAKHIPNFGRIVWDKKNDFSTFSKCELASHSFGIRVDKFDFMWNGMIQHDMKNKEQRIHPTQKPVKLYEWLLINYAKEGNKILDTHLGSGSIAIACHNLKFDLTACELDKDYFDASLKRLHNHQSQLTMF
jgi:site-specific DNA-methyltransferase (adenine-specific)